MVYGYLLATLAVVGLAWAWEQQRRYRQRRRRLRYRVRCGRCALSFEDRRTDEPLARCPRCGSPNERVRPEVI